MRHSIFTAMNAASRPGDVRGLRLAEVKSIDERGYILTWLSGNVRSDSAPARAASFMAGKERGAYFPYEQGDEVVVGFVDNDENYPIILGALWSSQDPPPPDADTSSSNNTRTIVSREGHQLTFDDTKQAGKVLLQSKGGMKIEMDDAAKTLTIQLDDSNKITFALAGITVTGTVINLN
ncbi:hypothetical protein JJJ17_11195 [Paracoccus caeni]|uniref:Gp5/Type VI secretion system Vgr protein OB-fold domain-containing protein n=1 Tax=Paracoccus caeni TaxID=657651 RepID=A0A934SEM9_9RHOB|nr:phage baseplate assembly protein V [Paracoccus caeni]MBK4216492.1 hypothetical protein [Paracoccus caeni]